MRENTLLGVKAARNSTLAMCCLVILKGGVGVAAGSMVLVADAVHTFLDVFTTLAVWIGLQLGLRSSSERFPYGYYKAENLAALFASVVILAAGVELIRGTLAGFLSPGEVNLHAPAIAVALFSALALYGLSRYKAGVGRQIGSAALIADARHSYVDMFTSVIVVLALAGSIAGLPQLESIGVIVISAMIFRLGILTAKDAVMVLMDAWLDQEVMERINDAIAKIPGVYSIESFKLRKAGLVVFGEVVITVKGEADLKKTEILSDEIAKVIKKDVENLEHAAVHIKPVSKSVINVAIPIMSCDGLNSKPSEHLGKAQHFSFIELEKGRVKNMIEVENPAASLQKKLGVKTAEFLIDHNIDVLVIKEIGPGPFYVLHDRGVTMLQMPEAAANTKKIIDEFDRLTVVRAPTEE